MTRRRWIADEVSGNRAALTGAHADHLARVLRARVGQEFDIAADGVVRRGRIISIAGNRVEFELGEDVQAAELPDITLAISIFKFDRLEWAIEKVTELGATSIIPVIARRTEAHLASAAAKRVERWQRIAREASQQSRRASVPEISPPKKLPDVLKTPGDLRIVLDESEQEVLLNDALQGKTSGDDVVLAFGPEGGWTNDELDQFRSEGWTSASLGNTILRAETAVIAATAVVVSEVNHRGTDTRRKS
jgi:16S rRNA (uracil1498-N3)-methyltransferase